MRARRLKGDDGVILPMALVFVTVIALVIGALLTQSSTQFKATRAFRDRQAGVFAADSGLERALAGIDMRSSSTKPDAVPTLSNNEQFAGEQFVFFNEAEITLDNFTVNAAPGTDRLVIVAVGNNNDNPPTSVRFGSHLMHSLGPRAEIGSHNTSLYYLLLDGEFDPALAAGDYDILARSSTVFIGSIRYTIHASLWTGVLQELDGNPFGPTDTGRAQSSSNVSSLSTVVSTDTTKALVFSAGGRDGGGSMATTTGMTRLTTGPGATSSIFGTSYAVVPDATIEFTATEAFSSSDSPATQAVGVFRPASWAPLEFGGLCEDPDALGSSPYNGYSVTVACVLNGAGDALTITATATSGDGERVVTARATVTRLPSGTIEITEWDTRPAVPDP